MMFLKSSIVFFSCLLTFHQCGGEEATIISSHLGKISGTRIRVLGKTIDEYLGIPFSKPITRKYRFKKAEAVEHYDTMIKANTLPPECPQIHKKRYLKMDENCLFLSIWNPVETSQDEAPKAVMFWISFDGSHQDKDHFNGRILSAFGDVIFVSANYRQGSFGFLTTGMKEEPGNLAYYDQNLALQWVHENIAYFGGDPSRVTVFGKEAGSAAISYHILSGKSAGLFKRAILQSSSYSSPTITFQKRTAIKKALKLAQTVGCATKKENFRLHREDIMKCMRNKRWQDIIEAEHKLDGNKFYPLLGEEFLKPEDILNFPNNIDTDVEVIIGINKEEGSSFVNKLDVKGIINLKTLDQHLALKLATLFLEDNYNEPRKIVEPYFENVDPKNPKELRTVLSNILTDYLCLCPALIFADSYSNKGGKVHFYYFTHYSSVYSIDPEWVGASSLSDLIFTLGEPLNPLTNSPDQDVEVSKYMMTLWSDFAKGKELAGWSPYKITSRLALELDPLKKSMVKIPRTQFCEDLWKPAFEEKIESNMDDELPVFDKKIQAKLPKYEF